MSDPRDTETVRAAVGAAPPGAAPSSSALRAAPAVGTRIDKYVIEGVIGSGGMGVVVAARHEQLGEPVAIKLLRGNKDPVAAERFVREARATARIKSEHVVRVVDAGQQDDGAPYLVMERLEGCDLGTLLQARGPLPWADVVEYVLQACEAIASAHAAGIVHRDLKPSNLFLTTRADGGPLVKVLDFGISKAVDGSEKDPRLTDTQAVFGSPTYMSPEQIRSSKNVDARTDVWALGVVLFELLTGKLPFIADNVAGLLASVVADPPLLPGAFVALPRELEAIILRCLEKDPEQRTRSAGHLALELAAFASPEGRLVAERAHRISSGARSSRVSFVPPAVPSAPPTALGTTGVALTAQQAPRGRPLVLAVAALGAIAFVVGALLFLARSAPGDRAAPAAARAAVASPEDSVALPPVPSTEPTASPPPTGTPATAAASASSPDHAPAIAPTTPTGKARPNKRAGAAQAGGTSAASPAPPPAPAAKEPDPFEGRH